MTRAELLKRMSSREITDWMVYEQLEPFGSRANFLGHAIVASTIANLYLKKGQKAFEPQDFMPVRGEKEPQSVDEMIQFAEMYTIALGGKDLRDKEE